jgi:hypothetical protein
MDARIKSAHDEADSAKNRKALDDRRLRVTPG